MKATIVGIESGSKYTDGEQRVTLRFEEADLVFREIRVPQSALGPISMLLDTEIKVTMAEITLSEQPARPGRDSWE